MKKRLTKFENNDERHGVIAYMKELIEEMNKELGIDVLNGDESLIFGDILDEVSDRIGMVIANGDYETKKGISDVKGGVVDAINGALGYERKNKFKHKVINKRVFTKWGQTSFENMDPKSFSRSAYVDYALKKIRGNLPAAVYNKMVEKLVKKQL